MAGNSTFIRRLLYLSKHKRSDRFPSIPVTSLHAIGNGNFPDHSLNQVRCHSGPPSQNTFARNKSITSREASRPKFRRSSSRNLTSCTGELPQNLGYGAQFTAASQNLGSKTLRHRNGFPRTHETSNQSSAANDLTDTIDECIHKASLIGLTPFTISSLDKAHAYTGRPLRELLLSALIILFCQSTAIVKRLPDIVGLVNKLFGTTLTSYVIKRTVFEQFCGGESIADITKTLAFLDSKGIGGILNYSSEANVISLRDIAKLITDEVRFETAALKNLQTVECCHNHLEETLRTNKIQDLSSIIAEQFVAVKVSSLVDLDLLLRISQLVIHADYLWAALSGCIDRFAVEKLLSCNSYTAGLFTSDFAAKLLEANVSRNTFLERATELFPDVCVRKLDAIFAHISADGSSITYDDWIAAVTPLTLSDSDSCIAHLLSPDSTTAAVLELDGLTIAELQGYEAFTKRLDKILVSAQDTPTVSVALDAERYDAQTAINFISREASAKYNKKRPIIYTTFQCYLRDAIGLIQRDSQLANRHGYSMGFKLVRGAYLEHERSASETNGFQCPILDTIEGTHASYDEAVAITIKGCKKSQNRVLCGTHNKESIAKGVNLVHETFHQDDHQVVKLKVGEDKDDNSTSRTFTVGFVPVSFGQLLGMCDTTTCALANSHIRAYKFIPYGCVEDVMPYLIRRVSENSGMMGNSNRELHFIMAEIQNRAKLRCGSVSV